jgi:hypothetical protein
LTIVRPILAELEPVFAEVERVVRRIAAARPAVSIRVLDPATASGGVPEIARDAGGAEVDLAGSGALVVELGDRRRVIDLFDLASFAAAPARPDRDVPRPAPGPPPVVTRLSVEAEIVARLRELADPRPLVVCATTGHGELGFHFDAAVAELSVLAGRIHRDGGRIEQVASLAAGVPAACSVVLIAGPTTALPPADALATERWLDTGGGLLVLAAARPDGGELPATGLEPVLARYGIELVDAVAVDAGLALDTPGALRVIDTYAEHPITAGFARRRTTVWLFPRTVSVEPPAEAIVATTAAGWGERRWRDPPVARDPDDARGPAAIVAVAEQGRGRVAVIGSAESLSSAVAPGASAGDLLALRAIRWLARRDQRPVALRDKTPEQVRLVMTASERELVIVLCVAGVPLGFGGLGVILAWRRRRRRARAEPS